MVRQDRRACRGLGGEFLGILPGRARDPRLGRHRAAVRVSDTWQLVINTGTTIVTFLMVFLIQNTQNRDTKALHLKLDELLRAQVGAREREFMDLEDLDEEQLKAERNKLFAECGVCASPEEHAQHGSADWRRRHPTAA
jgi:low affinity Fe/Cu permease